MPKFDTSTIDGFDAMTAEEQVAALLGVDIPEAVDLSLYVSKETFDKKASEAASLSKRLKEVLPAEKAAEEARKQAEAETAQRIAELEASNAELKKNQTISEYKAQYIAQGMDASLAEETAKALADGDMAMVFKNQAKHNESLEKKIKADLMKSDPKPGGAGGNGDDENSAGIEQAKKIGKAKAAANQATADVMKHYI